MKLIIFGATGTLGTYLVQQALQDGHQLSAFTRNPQKISISHPALAIVGGNILNPADVENSIRGHDAVLCAIGDGNKGTVRAEGTKNILAAMKATGVKRFICETTLGLGDSKGNLNFFWKHIMFGLLLKKAFADHQIQEEHIFNSQADYTIVRPGAFTNGSLTRNYKKGFDGNYKNLTLKISRADVADFMLEQLYTYEYRNKAVSISN